MSQPKKREAPAAMVRSGAQENNNDRNIIASLTDSIKAKVIATEYPEGDRPLFWGAFARGRGGMPCLKPIRRTSAEQHVSGIRTRQKVFRIFHRQRGSIDPALLVFAGVSLLVGGLAA